MYFLIGWAIFVGLVYLLMLVDYITHKYDVMGGLRGVAESFQEEE